MNKSLDHRVAVLTGTFDPVHHGHVDIIRRGSGIFDRVIVGVGINPDKTPLFTAEERVALLKEVSRPFPNVEVQEFNGLAVRFVRQVGARVMLRGLRTLSDMEYEFTMSLMNLELDAELETIFLMAKDEYSHLSSTLLRQIASFQGDLSNLSKFLPPAVQAALVAKMNK
jgi:pantetheine-phosphate adenylyltransferase